MNDPIAILRDRLAKAAAKVMRAQKSLDSAVSEMTDLQTAIRVIDGIVSESSGGPPSTAQSSAVSGRQTVILHLLAVGRESASPPAVLFEKYRLRTGEDITIDTFRTTIWRMADKIFASEDSKIIVKRGEDGYWKEVFGHVDEPDFSPFSFEDEDDPNIPF